MSSSVFVFGASGYIGLGVALAMRRAGYRVYGMIRNAKHSAMLVQQEINPIISPSFDDLQHVADTLASCSIIIDAIGFNQELSPLIFKAARRAGNERTHDGKLAHYAPLFIFTSGIMTYGDTSPTGRRPVDETIKPRPPLANNRQSTSSSDVTNMKEREDYENEVLANSCPSLRTTVIRPGFVYGGQGGFVANYLYGEPLVFQGRRDMRWSWVHIDDLSEGYVAAARAPRCVVSGQLYNLAAPNDNPTYEELRIAMARAQGRTEKFEYKEVDTAARWDTDSIINPAKAMNELGWRPRHVGFVEEIDTYYKAWAAYKVATDESK